MTTTAAAAQHDNDDGHRNPSTTQTGVNKWGCWGEPPLFLFSFLFCIPFLLFFNPTYPLPTLPISLPSFLFLQKIYLIHVLKLNKIKYINTCVSILKDQN